MKKYFSRPGFGARFGSFMLCVAMLLCLTATVILADIRIATEKDNLSAIIKQALFTTQTVRLPSASGSGQAAVTVRPRQRLAMPRLDEAGTSSEVSDAMVEMIYNIVMEQTGGEVDLSLEEAKEFVEESTLDEFISDTSAALVSDLITGENTIDLSDETISGLLEENAPLFEQYFGVTMDQQTIAIVTAQVTENEYVQQIRDKGINKFVEENAIMMEEAGLGNLLGSSSGGTTVSPDGSGSSGGSVSIVDILNTARSFTSVTALAVCIAAVLVFIGLLCLANLKHIWYAIRGTGRTFIISTFLVSIVTLVMMGAPAVWSNVFSFSPMIGNVAAMILKFTAPVHLGIMGAGLVLALLGTVLKFVAKGKARKRYLAEMAASVEAPAVEAPAEAIPVVEAAEEPVLVMEIPAEDGAVVEIPVEEVPAEEAPAESGV